MFKSLFASILLSGSVGFGSSQPMIYNQRQPVVSRSVSNSDDTLYYQQPKYQTNEVSSTSDLIPGNVYRFYPNRNNRTVDEINYYFDGVQLLNIYGFDLYQDSDEYLIDVGYTPYSYLSFGDNELWINITLVIDFTTNLYVFAFYDNDNLVERTDIYYDIVYPDISTEQNLTDFFTISTYQEYEFVAVPTSNSNLYTLLYDFYKGLFNNTDLGNISYSIGNSTMTMSSWLAHTLTIVTLLTFVVILFFFLKWLFKLVSGLILLKN